MNNTYPILVISLLSLIAFGSAQGQEPYFGIEHSPLGDASLSAAESHGQLIVSNIGSSGDDGVEISTGPADGLIAFLDAANCQGTFADGTALQLATLPIPVEGAGFFSYAADLNVDLGQWQANIINNGNPSVCLDATVLNNDEPVGTASCVAFGTAAASWTAAACPNAMGWVQYDDGPGFGIVLFGNTTFTLADSQELSGDEIRFLPQAQPENDVEAFALTAAGINPLVIDNEWLQKFGNMHHAEGGTRMFPTTDFLPLANIGETGEDGVTVEVIDSFFRIFVQVISDPDPVGAAPVGARLILQSRGLLSGNPDAELGTMAVVKTGSGINTIIDLSPVGSATAQAQFYLEGSLLTTETGVSGEFLTASDWPTYTGYVTSGYPAQPAGFILGYEVPTLFTVAGGEGPGIFADEVRILDEGGTPVGGLAQYTMRIAGIDQLTIIDEKGTELDDTDLDGVPDVVDNCVVVANNNQIDTNGDGIGNICDGDVTGPTGDEDCIVNFPDLDALKEVFFLNDTDPGYDPDLDFNSDGFINFPDLDLMAEFFFLPPGPSATGCN